MRVELIILFTGEHGITGRRLDGLLLKNDLIPHISDALPPASGLRDKMNLT